MISGRSAWWGKAAACCGSGKKRIGRGFAHCLCFVPCEPNNVTFLLKMLFALIEPMSVPSASRNVRRYSKTYFRSTSQNPLRNGFGSFSTMMMRLTFKRSIVTAAALSGGLITSPSLRCWSPMQPHSAARAGPICAAVRQSCWPRCMWRQRIDAVIEN